MNIIDKAFVLAEMLLNEKNSEWKRLEHDANWWTIRAIILAKDRGREVGPGGLVERIELRMN